MKRTDSIHARRLSDQIQREVAEILATQMGDPRLEGVSISGVRLNANLRVAEVLYTMGDGDARRQEVAKAFAQSAGRIRSLLGKRLRSRALPELRFTFDTFLEDVIYAGPHPVPDSNDADSDAGDPAEDGPALPDSKHH